MKYFVCGIASISGPERDRTADPLLAKQVLSQLSYRPANRNTAQNPKHKMNTWAQVDSNH